MATKRCKRCKRRRKRDEISIKQNNMRLCDTLEYAKNGTLEEELRKLFNLN